jgi:light-regulated signal transduction histidine kinase (bacteriophytochrome)/CheY-like chemotaxis protein
VADSTGTFDVDLTNCDREPIHELGAIQPFGFLLALSTDWLIQRTSANIVDFFGLSADEMIGTQAADHLGMPTVHTLRNRLTLLRGIDAVERVFGHELPGHANRFDFAIHLSNNSIIVEAEPCVDETQPDTASTIRAMISRLDASQDERSFLREGARQVRALTGFDRVMVYRFDADGSGQVVAEAARSGIGSFLDLRYPASDIPLQARRLYLRTPFRIIPDIEAAPSPIYPRLDERGQPLDLSLSVLRSVSPIHIEYLRNMGVGASMSISIVIEGRLWGLFACHHYDGPRLPGFERRSIAELFGQMFALKLESRERKAMAGYEASARAGSDRLLAAIAGDSTLLENPDWLGSMLQHTVPNDGIAIWMNGRVAQDGLTPPAGELRSIVRRLNAMAAGRVYATDRLADTIPSAAAYDDVAAGVLAIPVSRSPRDYVMLFRQEKIRTVTWAGDPHKPAQYGPHGARLTPRQSFEAWSQEVRGRSQPFSEAELRVAEMLRISMIEIVLRMTDEAQEERRRAAERQDLLIAELNHRVRNILALIRGLMRQSREPGDAHPGLNLLEGRIQSLARAHDQITKENWSPAPLALLIETEAAAYLGGKSDRIESNGPDILLQPQAFTTLALVFHELMTNSAKYGALSDSGRVTVDWRLDADGDLQIEWRERGGPPVKPPTREGFGSTIIHRSIPYDLGGQARVRYDLIGLEVDLCVPSRHLSEATGRKVVSARDDAPTESVPNEGRSMLSGAALLVEDSLIIAMEAEDILQQLGAERVATVSNIAQAMAEIERDTFEVALLDVNLGQESSIPVAERLAERGIPFLFTTGYGEQMQRQDKHKSAVIVNKPYNVESISAGLAKVLRK